MPPTRSLRNQNNSPSAGSRSTTARRAAAEAAAAKPSIRITVKAPPSKLRQALTSSDGETPEPPVRNARSTRNPRKVIEPDTDEEEMDDAEEPEEDAPGEDEELEDEEEEEEDAEGEEEEEVEDEDEEEDEEDDEDDEEDAEGDISMAESPHPPPPAIKVSGKIQPAGKQRSKLGIVVAGPAEGTLKSVEAKEAEMEDMSDLGSDDAGEAEDDEGLSDSDSEGGGGSGSATPDLSKLTRRQKAIYDDDMDGSLLALSNEAQKKKHLTAEEHAMRRAEMARRRKNLSEKRNEEEKMDTINKLLKKPAPKRRTRAEMIAAAAAADTPGLEDGEQESAYPLYTRWVNNSSGSRLGVPTEWLEGPVGEALSKGWTKPPPRALVEEVEG
ncbi:hypothetical protein K461DRAFT_293105 [Myriangium duriaei CBS 260.36]|uniref:INO80 complex subunit B-like conserved region domain-containing protein n=1 Tax=Myriangium duriaei CBS 260.36 TaxID=1168546 RepID=A0A9P4J5G5_9PEZI|nr:hypothetical protein K461DRAFT_293105 [Myriangium duriaei CBS 260.36]